jgi:hypothetical protein
MQVSCFDDYGEKLHKQSNEPTPYESQKRLGRTAILPQRLSVDRFRCVESVTASQCPTQTNDRWPLVEHVVSHIHDFAGGYVYEK